MDIFIILRTSILMVLASLFILIAIGILFLAPIYLCYYFYKDKKLSINFKMTSFLLVMCYMCSTIFSFVYFC